MRLTKHKVRDLNGPNLDGRHNGRRFKNCGHYRNPDMATYPEDRLMLVTRADEFGGTVSIEKLVRHHVCITCGEVRFTDEDE